MGLHQLKYAFFIRRKTTKNILQLFAHCGSYIHLLKLIGMISERRVVCYQPSGHKHQCTKKRRQNTKP